MTNRDRDIETLAQVIRAVEEVRLDLRAMHGFGPNDPMPPHAGGGRDAQLAAIRNDVSAVYAHLLAEAVPVWAAGNSGPGPRVGERAIYRKDEDGVGEPVIELTEAAYDRAATAEADERNEEGKSRFTGTSDDGMPSREF